LACFFLSVNESVASTTSLNVDTDILNMKYSVFTKCKDDLLQ
jgi:hypothetical protein